MFRALICPSSGVCDYVVKLPYWLSRCASPDSPDTTPAEAHSNSNTQQTKNVTVNVVVQLHSRKLLKMGILMPETCWVCKKKNKISQWRLVALYCFNEKCASNSILNVDNDDLWQRTCRIYDFLLRLALKHYTRSVSVRLMAECFESRFCHVQYVINTGLLSFNDVIPYSLCCFLSPFPVQLPILAVALPPYINIRFSSSINYLLFVRRARTLKVFLFDII